MANALKKRSVRIAGHDTSITLEDAFWLALHEIAEEEKLSINKLIAKIDNQREGNLSSSLRLYILRNLQEKLAQQSF